MSENYQKVNNPLRSVTVRHFISDMHGLLKKCSQVVFLSKKQESPPAWTQEAYYPPCSEYSFWCSNWVPPQQGTPPARYPPWAGYPPDGPGRVPPPAGPGRVPLPPGCPMAFWVMLQSIMGYGYPPPPCGQTDGRTDACQNITFPSYYVRGR